MPIDHAEALQRGREYLIENGSVFTSMYVVGKLAEVIERAVRDTALECSEICRRHADRAPGGLVPVGVGARASDEIRHVFGLVSEPVQPLACPRSLCQLCGGTGIIGSVDDCPRCSPVVEDKGHEQPASAPSQENS